MFVYGIRCAPADLLSVAPHMHQGSTNADYYMDYGLLIFPQYTRPSVLRAHTGLTPEFWDRVRRIIATPGRPHSVELEHPWLTDEQSDVIRIIKEAYPSSDTDWYHVPVIATQPAA